MTFVLRLPTAPTSSIVSKLQPALFEGAHGRPSHLVAHVGFRAEVLRQNGGACRIAQAQRMIRGPSRRRPSRPFLGGKGPLDDENVHTRRPITR